MEYLSVVVLVAFAAAFIVSVVDYWVDVGIGRAGIAWGACAVGVIPFEFWWPTGVICALAGGFVSMFLLTTVERMNFRAVGRAR